VLAVVGPLMKNETEAAAPVADELGVPLLSLTRHEEVARGRADVFALGLSRRMEAEVLAEHAVYDLGLGRFAILYPTDEYGHEFESLLWRAVEARGGRVVGVAGYPPSATEFEQPLRTLLGPDALPPALAAAAPAAPGAADPGASAPAPALDAPHVDFDALFLPDAHDKIVLIAHALSSDGISGLQLLGPSGWYDPALARRAGPMVNGAFFSSPFDPGNPSPLVQEFVRRYEDAYGREPSPFAAQGFDAANLVGLQVVAGATTPGAVRDGLLGTDRYPGVSGVTSIDRDGGARKRPFLLQVRDGQTVSVE
jgi:branched-chain amino acid transport system substrate-binding protein